MSRTLLSLAGFQVILIGRFWVIAEDFMNRQQFRKILNIRLRSFPLKSCRARNRQIANLDVSAINGLLKHAETTVSG